MRKELQRLLSFRYQRILKDLWGDPRSDLYHGILCGDGWFQLLDDMFGFIQVQVDIHHWQQPIVTSIKTSPGGILDIHWNYESLRDEKTLLLLQHVGRFVNYVSSDTCEFCGTRTDVGSASSSGVGVKTCCASCWSKHLVVNVGDTFESERVLLMQRENGVEVYHASYGEEPEKEGYKVWKKEE